MDFSNFDAEKFLKLLYELAAEQLECGIKINSIEIRTNLQNQT